MEFKTKTVEQVQTIPVEQVLEILKAQLEILKVLAMPPFIVRDDVLGKK